MLMIDIAVPRDIEPQVRDLRDVYLYSVDDLGQIVDGNLRARQKEVSKADEIIALGIASVGEEQRSLGAVDLVKEYRQSAEALRQRELERALTSISRGEDPQKVLVQLARAITNKLIPAPTTGLKKASAEGRHDVLGHAARLLGLRVDDLDAQPNTARSPSGSPSGSPSDKTEQNTEASSSESAAISPMSPVTNAAQAKSAIESESPRTPGPTLQ
jgi:glutamyl-tRNA reductase